MSYYIKKNFFILLLAFVFLLFLILELNILNKRIKSNTCNYPNFLLLTLDSLRSDHLHSYGYDKNTSPFFDLLAERGIVFSDAVSPGTLTASSLTSIQTSLYPSQHGCLDWNGCCKGITTALPTLNKVFKDNGYQTVFMSNHSALKSIRGFSEGWDVWVDKKGTAEELVSRLMNWFQVYHKEPFFIWVHFFEPHFPYSPPSPFDLTFTSKEITTKKIKQWEKNHSWRAGVDESIAVDYLKKHDRESVNLIISQYDGSIAYVDKQVQILFNFFEKNQFQKNMVTAITADHGEAFNDRPGFFFHGGSPYEALVKIPLILLAPDCIPGGKSISTQVSSMDIMPTFLDMAGLQVPDSIAGKSLLNAINNPAQPIHQVMITESRNSPTGFWVGLRSGHLKVILSYFNDTPRFIECYDLKDDPGEKNDLSLTNIDKFENLLQFTKKYESEYLKSLIKSCD